MASEWKRAVAWIPMLLRGIRFMAAAHLGRSDLMAEAAILAEHLEADLFPNLRREGTEALVLGVPEGEGPLVLRKRCELMSAPLPGTERIAGLLRGIGVTCWRLDPRLESSQMIDVLGLLGMLRDPLVAVLASGATAPDPGACWDRDRLAAAIPDAGGLHRFCAILHLDRTTGDLSLRHTICEVHYSQLSGTVVNFLTSVGEHRDLRRALPRLVLLVLVGGAGCGLAWLQGPVVGAVATSILTVGAAVAVGYLTYCLAGILREREQRDVLLRERIRDITALSHFPRVNPNILFKLDGAGRVLFRNPAANWLLASAGTSGVSETADCSRDLANAGDASGGGDVAHGRTDPLAEAVLPDDFRARIRAFQGMAEYDSTDPAFVEARGPVEKRVGDRILSFLFSPFPGEDAFLAAGADVTELRRLQEELREANTSLEARVRERTKELQLTQEVTILSLSGLAETRDPETGAHIERTRLYVRVLAETLRDQGKFLDILTPPMIEKLYQSAPLHDIGKVGVPDSILLKPGRLTDEEFVVMKRHAEFGGDALRWAEERLGGESFLGVAREIAYAHHEKWDGSGYPRGVAGDKIPLSARIMALADVYDALISKRCYKEAMPHAQARAIILEGAGRHFDPDVVAAFIASEDRFEEIAAAHVDEADGVRRDTKASDKGPGAVVDSASAQSEDPPSSSKLARAAISSAGGS